MYKPKNVGGSVLAGMVECEGRAQGGTGMVCGCSVCVQEPECLRNPQACTVLQALRSILAAPSWFQELFPGIVWLDYTERSTEQGLQCLEHCPRDPYVAHSKGRSGKDLMSGGQCRGTLDLGLNKHSLADLLTCRCLWKGQRAWGLTVCDKLRGPTVFYSQIWVSCLAFRGKRPLNWGYAFPTPCCHRHHHCKQNQ